jgi:tetraacyldisaccharide 4'-kinase
MSFFITFLRLLLFPFAILYGAAVRIRHFLYDSGVLKSVQPKTKTICVGNLSVGGTGKSPMIEFLVNQFAEKYSMATLSRGYGRASKGFLKVDEVNPKKFGDEPAAFKQKFSHLPVYVCEDRVNGVAEIESEFLPNVILLDDAFQHRALKPHFNIVITDFNKPFYTDFYLPTGNLRDSKLALKRADVLVFSKCPAWLDEVSKEEIQKIVLRYSGRKIPVFFAQLAYALPYQIKSLQVEPKYPESALCLTGIANPKPLVEFLSDRVNQLQVLSFKDHHEFTQSDVAKIEKHLSFLSGEPSIITTEKDAVRLNKVLHFFKTPVQILVQPIKVDFGDDEPRFLALIEGVLKK